MMNAAYIKDNKQCTGWCEQPLWQLESKGVGLGMYINNLKSISKFLDAVSTIMNYI
jgi:hypothetical protein